MTPVEPFNFPGPPALTGDVPAGYRTTIRSRVLYRPDSVHTAADPAVSVRDGATTDAAEAVFRRAGTAVLSWRAHSGAGFRAVSVPDRVTLGAVSEWEIPFGPLHPRVRCRVFEVVDEPGRVGFGHGALAGHPQSGWESYLVTLDNNTVTLTIRVVWKPDAWWMRAAGPASALALEILLRRNLGALDSVIGAD